MRIDRTVVTAVVLFLACDDGQRECGEGEFLANGEVCCAVGTTYVPVSKNCQIAAPSPSENQIQPSKPGAETPSETSSVPADVTVVAPQAGQTSTAGGETNVQPPPASVKQPPEAPSNLQVVAGKFAEGMATTILTWTDNSKDEDSFLVERAAGAESSFKLVKTLPAEVITCIQGQLYTLYTAD